MNFKILFLFLTSTLLFGQNNFITPYERGYKNKTTTYDEMNVFYQNLEKKFETIQYVKKGEDDNGKSIYVVVFNPFKEKDIKELRKTKAVLFINNGIHPGEPDGIDATMMLMRDLAMKKIKPPKNFIIAAISAYNVSGMLNRGSFSRANQNGPEQYGFRGNARNYDLNRDFIKMIRKMQKVFRRFFIG